MAVPSLTVISIFIVLTLFILAVLAFTLPRFRNTATQTFDIWDLKGDGSSPPTLPSTIADAFSHNTSATVRLFVLLTSLPRTRDVDTYVPPENGICTIGSPDTCTKHPGYVRLLSFEDSVWIELLQAPDAARPGQAAANLCVRTTSVPSSSTVSSSAAPTFTLETVPLPAFPLQKWVMLTLVREGSRFDIYYNNSLQTAVKTAAVPTLAASVGTVGSPLMKGRAQYPLATARAYQAADVARDYAALTDTRGEPLPSTFSRGLGTYTFSLCPSGNCFGGPTMKPANPLLQWNSNYM